MKTSASSFYARMVIAGRRPVIAVLVIATLAAAAFVPQLNMRNDPDSLFPLSDPYVATNRYSEQRFGMGNIMVWGMKVKDGDIYQPWFINMVRDFHEDVLALEHANAANFIDLAAQKVRYIGLTEDGSLKFERLVPREGISADPEVAAAQFERMREGLHNQPVMETMLVYFEDAAGERCEPPNGAGARDDCRAKATFVLGDYNEKMKDRLLPWMRDLRAMMARYEAEYGDRVEFLLSGEPYFMAIMILEIVEKAWLFGISILIILAVLWLEYRSFRCALFPMAGVGMTIVLTLGVMGFTQFKLTTMMVLTPMLLLAVGIGHAMQITRRYLQELDSRHDPAQAAQASIEHTIVPATLSIVTDMAGFFTLSFVDISFYKAYAWFGMFGMATLLLTTTTLIPLLLVSFPLRRARHEQSGDWEQRFGDRAAALLTGRGRWLPVGFTAAVLAVSIYHTDLAGGISVIAAGGDTGDAAETARIREEFDIMPGVEKGVNYPRAAYKDYYLLGDLLGGDGKPQPLQYLEELGRIMPGVITINVLVRGKQAVKPACGLDAWNENDERVQGPDVCFDMEEDPPQGIFNRADVLAALSELEDWMRTHDNITFTISYAQIIKTINMLLVAPPQDELDDHRNLYAIPTAEHMQANLYAYADPNDPDYLPSPDGSVRLYNGMMEANTQPGDLDSFLDTNGWNEGMVIGFIRSMDPLDTRKTISDVQDYLWLHRNEPGFDRVIFGLRVGERIELPSGDLVVNGKAGTERRPAFGGFLGITEATRNVAMREWLKSPLLTALGIFLIAALMFRSVAVSLLLMCLLFITLASQYGLGGYLTSIREWSANLAFHVQVALSIAMGLGVDYGVYMISRLREEMHATGGRWHAALQNTLSSTGAAIVISVVVLLASLVPLMNLELANTWSVSLYIGEALILDMLTAVLLLPLLVRWVRPRFVFEGTGA